jgi:hypothetical protein
MPTAESRIRVHELVAAIIDRLPVILTEVRLLLVEQQPDYAGFLAGDFEEVLRASRGFIARLVREAARDGTVALGVTGSGRLG